MLTRVNDKRKLYINPTKISWMEEFSGSTVILVEGERHYVVELVKDIIRDIDDQQMKLTSEENLK